MFDRKMLVDARVAEFRARRDAFLINPNAVHPRGDMDFDQWLTTPGMAKR